MRIHVLNITVDRGIEGDYWLRFNYGLADLFRSHEEHFTNEKDLNDYIAKLVIGMKIYDGKTKSMGATN